MEYRVIRNIFNQTNTDGGFSFEETVTRVDIIKYKDKACFLRIYEKKCYAEDNGKPITEICDYAYPIESVEQVTAKDWKEIRIDRFSERIELQHSFFDGVL